MLIGLNAKALSTRNPAGPELYTYNIFKHLLSDTGNQYILYTDKYFNNENRSEFRTLNPTLSFKTLRSKPSWTQISLAMELIKNPPDVYFTAEHTIPFLNPRRVPIVAMIHGLEYKTNKELKPYEFRALIHPLILKWVTFFAKTILVPSESVRQALNNDRFLKVPNNKISVVTEGVGTQFYRRANEDVSEVRNKYNLPQKYLLFVSTIQPRKNLPVLIEAFSNVIKGSAALREYKLVIVGKKGWGYEESLKAPEKYGIPDSVLFLDYAPKEDLPPLYSGASLYVNISVDEGFGLTLLEALASGVPCVVSDIPAFREVGKEYPYYTGTSVPKDISDVIVKVLTEGRDYSRIESGRKHALSYSWEASAYNILKILTSAGKKR